MKGAREQAKQDGLKHYFTGLPCKHGHIDKRQTSDGTCMACSREKSSKWVLFNREKYLELKTASNDKRKTKNQAYARMWRQANPEKKNAFEANRRASKLQRTPAWANQSTIKMFYEVAEVLSRGGVLFHVDHIIPLKGKQVSGFHVENNLQVLPWYQNLSKGNRL
jgi:hypothetical protein